MEVGEEMSKGKARGGDKRRRAFLLRGGRKETQWERGDALLEMFRIAMVPKEAKALPDLCGA